MTPQAAWTRRRWIALAAGALAVPARAQENVRNAPIPLWDPQHAGEAALFNPSEPFESAVGQPGWRGRAPDELVERARLALSTLTTHVRENGVPYFNIVINYRTGEVSLPAKGTGWDHISQTGRSVNAILCIRDMTGDWKSGVPNEEKIRKVLLGDFREDGFNYLEDGTAMMHDQNRALLGLTNWYLHAGGERERAMLRGCGDRLVGAFIRTAKKQGAAWSMPGMWYSPAKGFYETVRAPGNHGRTIMPLIEYTRATGNGDALALAEHYANHVLNVSDSFRFDSAGNFAGFGDESPHVHSVAATVAGLALLGAELERRDLVERAFAIYEHGLKLIGTDFGWLPESNPNIPMNMSKPRMLRQTTCENCCVTDYIEAAIYLARAGYEQCWAEAERYLRNQLFENQMTTAAWVKPAEMQPRILGGFTARASPNRMYDLFHESGPIGCCNAAGVRALHLAWKYGLEQTGRGVRVNLLFDRETAFARVESGLPARGLIRVTMKTDGPLEIRVPEWARHVVASEPATAASGASWRGHFYRLPEAKKGQTVELKFPLARSSREWLQPPTKWLYRTEWLGDTVVSISPRGNCFPLYERTYLLT